MSFQKNIYIGKILEDCKDMTKNRKNDSIFLQEANFIHCVDNMPWG